MSIFTPIKFAFGAFNTVSNVYLCSRIGLYVYKQANTMRKERLRAGELRKKFVDEYQTQHGQPPSEEIIQIALRAYDAVERPFVQKGKEMLEKIRKTF